MSVIDETGLSIDRYTEILAKLIEDYKATFGEDMAVDDPRSVSGKDANIFATAVDDQNGLIQGVADAFDTNNSKGIYLSRLVLLNGIERKENQFSTVSVNVTAGTASAEIFQGDLVSDQNEVYTWAIDSDVTLLPFETKSVSATCQVEGAISVAQDTITKIITKRYSWETVNNPASSTVGRKEETDTALKIRRRETSKGTSTSSGPSVNKNLFQTENVAFANTFFNTEEVTDSDGILPGGIWAIVKGGSDSDIIETLVKSCSPTTRYKGSVTGSYTDEYGKSYAAAFDRPDDIDNYIYVRIKANSSFPKDGTTQLKNNLKAFYDENIGIGTTVPYGRLYTPINDVQGHTVQELWVSAVSPPTSNDKSDLLVEKYQQAVVITSNIEVDVIEV